MHTDTETEDLQIEPSEDDLVVDEEEPIAEEEVPQATTNNKRARRRRRVARGGITEGTLSNDPTRDYLRRAGRVPLLSAAEEVELAIRIADGVAAAEKLEQAEEEGIELDRAERRALMKAEQSGHDAKNELVEANLRLVVSIAKRYIGRGLPFSDLIQEGNIGLMRAADKFDHTKGFKFSTYATWWIRQAVTRAIADQARTIRIPVHMTETVNKISRVQRELTVELGHEPSNAELAKALGMDEERVVEIRQLTMEPVSLETPIGEEEDSSLGDFIRDDNAVAPIEAAAHSLLGEALHEELSQLKEREQEVLVMRFGLDGNTPMTLEEVGRKLGVTRERVRQIEAKTLAKLRHPSRSKDLKEYLEA